MVVEFNKLTKLRVLGLDFLMVEQDEGVSLKELKLPNLRTLSLCNSPFMSQRLLIECSGIWRLPSLTVEVENGKFDQLVLKEFKDMMYNVVSLDQRLFAIAVLP